MLVVVIWLPGTGKSFFSQRLMEHVPLALLETDALRKVLFSSPTFSAEESAHLFQATHRLIEELLDRGVPVLLDATNLIEANREHLYNIADQRAVKLILVGVEAPPEVVRERLESRTKAGARWDHSEAGWEVYQRMRPSVQPIRRNHFAVDTTHDVGPVDASSLTVVASSRSSPSVIASDVPTDTRPTLR